MFDTGNFGTEVYPPIKVDSDTQSVSKLIYFFENVSRNNSAKVDLCRTSLTREVE